MSPVSLMIMLLLMILKAIIEELLNKHCEVISSETLPFGHLPSHYTVEPCFLKFGNSLLSGTDIIFPWTCFFSHLLVASLNHRHLKLIFVVVSHKRSR